MFSREKWQITSLTYQEVIKIWKQTWWSNDKTVFIIELSYHKILWFVSVSQIIYLPHAAFGNLRRMEIVEGFYGLHHFNNFLI